MAFQNKYKRAQIVKMSKMISFQSRICMCSWTIPQKEKARGMATLKAISIRLKSVKNIQKITQSMKMVSAAKYSRAERELKQAKPMGLAFKSFFTRITDLEKDKEEKTPVEEGPKKILYLTVTSDRGLCGAVHSSVAKVIRNTLADPGDNVKLVCIGDKSRALLQRLYSANILFVCQEVGRLPPSFQDASAVANEIFRSDFQFESLKIIFNRYRSVVSYATEEILIYNYDMTVKAPALQPYEDANEETLLPFIQFSLASLIFYAMKEGACRYLTTAICVVAGERTQISVSNYSYFNNEQSSRMTAMDNASKNAGEMISKLTLTYNRTRQAVITRELIEIISGASAL